MAEPICAPPCTVSGPGSLLTPAPPAPCCPPELPPAYTTTTETCAGTVSVSVTQTVEAVIPAGTVIRTRPCEGEWDSLILCAPDDTRVVAVVSYSLTGVPTTAYYNLDGTPYAGDPTLLVSCEGPELESDAQLWCDNGAQVTQWIVKSNGQPTGVSYWTDASGVVIPAPVPGPTLTVGICTVATVNRWRSSGILTPAAVFDIAANMTLGADLVSFTVSFLSAFGTIDGIVTPPGSWTWSAEDTSSITNPPTSITSTGEFYIQWTERS